MRIPLAARSGAKWHAMQVDEGKRDFRLKRIDGERRQRVIRLWPCHSEEGGEGGRAKDLVAASRVLNEGMSAATLGEQLVQLVNAEGALPE